MRTRLSLVSLLTLTLVFAACSSNPNLPSEAGNFSGTLTDQTSGNGTITLTLQQIDNSLVGNYTIAGLPQSADNETGSVSGAVTSNTAATMTFAPTDINRCVLFATVTINGNQLTASYNSPTCSFTNVQTGTFVVNKQ